MRVLFIGGTERGFRTLQALQKLPVTLVGVISLRQDDHEIARYEDSIRSFTEAHQIPCCESKWLKDRDFVTLIKNEWKPDLCLVVGCRILIPQEIYSLPPQGTLAVHDSLLPEYRGFAPLNWSILNGEEHVGATLFYLSERMDGGDILAQKSIAVDPKDTAPEVYDRMCQITIDLVEEAIPLLIRGAAPRVPQDYGTGSFTCSRTPRDGRIHWEHTTRMIYDQIRGLAHPYPGAFTYVNGQKLIINKAEIVEPQVSYIGRIPGRVVGISKPEGSVDVLTGDGMLRICEVKDERGQLMKPSLVIRSIRTTLGIDVEELLERIQKLEAHIEHLTGTPEREVIPLMNR